MMNEEIWAIIPARGGSKGVKEKNIKKLNDKPLIAYSIEVLKKSKCFDKIIVSSDSEKILKVSKNYGAEVFLRTNKNESDDFTMPDVPTVSCLKEFSSKMPKFTFMVQCTAPFIKPKSYKKGIELLKENNDSTVFAAVEANYFLWNKIKKNDPKSSWKTINHPFETRVGRQFNKDKQVHETGAFYGFLTENFIKAEHRFFKKAYPIIIDDKESLDINSQKDWDYANFIYKTESHI